MRPSTEVADEIISRALDAWQDGGDALVDALESLPGPVYITDAEGVVIHFNRACIGFSGRTPKAGKDRWCVTWKLYTEDGAFLPHRLCPMALAIREARSVRGIAAVAERPDRTRVNFMPFPTPLFDEDGLLVGAVNLLVDITEARQIAELREQADRCRRLANRLHDRSASEALSQMAMEFDEQAAELEQGPVAIAETPPPSEPA